MNFREFAALIRVRFDEITENGEVFHVDVSRDDLWKTYLESFPEGSNPLFRKRTEHDCSTCRQFIRGVGGIITLDKDGNYQTVWDVEAEDHYDAVAKSMAEFVRCRPIDRVYHSKEPGYGCESNIESVENGPNITWHHLHCRLPTRLVVPSVGDALEPFTAAHQVLSRGLVELSLESLEVVMDLIESNSLYRGEEHKKAVEGFLALKKKHDALRARGRENFVWANLSHPYARFRNTAIGTLVQDLSGGMDVTRAVNRFESKVAPHNYQRTSALITQSMVDKALETLRELELEDAVHRRFAVAADVSPNDVLFVDRSMRPHMKDGLADLLSTAIKPAEKKVPKGAVDITAESFFAEILPGAEGVEILLERAHLPNFVSLTAPVHSDTGQLFKWDNDFAWVYDGNMADSAMRKAVQDAGGRVDGVFRFTHSWNYGARNASLMDLHVFMPGNRTKPENGTHDQYGNLERVGWNHRSHRSGGTQDVDYVRAAEEGYVPVENITFPDINRMPAGRYICKIHNWNLRPPTKGGFRAEIEFGGQLYEYEYSEPMGHKEWVTVAEVTLKAGVFSIKHHLKPSTRSTEKWGVSTGKMVPVDTIMLSPNHWGDQSVGNRHHIFVLRGCLNPDSVRGFFNEYLRADLHPHRKVFEILAGKLKCEPTSEQLSGVGFSSTRHDRATFTVRKGGSTRTYNVQF